MALKAQIWQQEILMQLNMYFDGLLQCLYNRREGFEWQKMKTCWFLTPSWHSHNLWGILGWWLRANKQMKWFPPQPLVIKQWWLIFVRSNVFLKLTENTHLKNLLVLEADKMLSWNYPKKSKREEKWRKTGCMNLEGRPEFFSSLYPKKTSYNPLV